jgi:hypothetical protein
MHSWRYKHEYRIWSLTSREGDRARNEFYIMSRVTEHRAKSNWFSAEITKAENSAVITLGLFSTLF